MYVPQPSGLQSQRRLHLHALHFAELSRAQQECHAICVRMYVCMYGVTHLCMLALVRIISSSAGVSCCLCIYVCMEKTYVCVCVCHMDAEFAAI
jgi:hypothetical protein